MEFPSPWGSRPVGDPAVQSQVTFLGWFRVSVRDLIGLIDHCSGEKDFAAHRLLTAALQA
jgi:hypothetical protein